MLSRSNTYVLDGVQARPATIECDLRAGLPSFSIIGLSDIAARELRETVRAAIINAGYDFPQQRVTINIAPASLRRAAPSIALAAALALLAASGQINAGSVAQIGVYGDLTLSGHVRALPATLATAAAHQHDRQGKPLLHGGRPLPHDLAPNPALPVTHLSEVPGLLARDHYDVVAYPERPTPNLPDFADVHGHRDAIYALTVAAASGLHLLIRGAPGSGKTMLARRLPSILPELTDSEAREVAIIHDAAGMSPRTTRPFRAPHHTISAAGLVGGGSPVRPGEITLAHRGVLLLDQITEMQRAAVEALRSPLEQKSVTLIRGEHAYRFPACFQLVAATTHCPCGHPDRERCQCTEETLARWLRRLSTPLLDRIAITIDLPAEIQPHTQPGPTSAALREQVTEARARRAHRELHAGGLTVDAALNEEAARALKDAYLAGTLSVRGRETVLQIARTVADLAGQDAITAEAVHTALALRGGKPAPALADS